MPQPVQHQNSSHLLALESSLEDEMKYELTNLQQLSEELRRRLVMISRRMDELDAALGLKVHREEHSQAA